MNGIQKTLRILTIRASCLILITFLASNCAKLPPDELLLTLLLQQQLSSSSDVTEATPETPVTPATISCTTVAENATATPTCSGSQTIIGIDFASYGTPTGTCENYAIGACHQANSQTIVETACSGNTTCSVTASNAVFTDPCGGTVKNLTIQYQCQ